MKGLLKKAPVFLALAGTAFCFFIFANSRFHSPVSSQLTPWVAVGGCGSSAGGASGDAQVKWIGNGVAGALFDCELLVGQGMLSKTSTKVIGVDSVYDSEYNGLLRMISTTALLSLYYHPPRIMDIKLTMPFLFKEGINAKDKTITNTGPFGDLSLDLSRKLGTSGNINAGLVVVFPTGNASIMKGGIEPMPPDNQLGGGLFSASARGSYTFDFDWGIINLGATYSAGLFAIKTTEYNFDSTVVVNGKVITDAKLSSKKQEFEFAREGFGARNDAGLFTPDNIGVFTDFGIKTQDFTHGFSINFGYPLLKGFAEQREVLTTSTTLTLTTKTDAQLYLDTCRTGDVSHGDTLNILLNQTGNGTWNYLKKAPFSRKTLPFFTLQYSIEKSDMIFPLLLGGVVKLEYENKFIFSGFSVGVGFKFPVY
jgi:hypothetical protein